MSVYRFHLEQNNASERAGQSPANIHLNTAFGCESTTQFWVHLDFKSLLLCRPQTVLCRPSLTTYVMLGQRGSCDKSQQSKNATASRSSRRRRRAGHSRGSLDRISS